MPPRNLTILMLGVAVCLLCYQRGELNPFARYTAEALEKIDRYAYDDVPGDKLFEAAMQGMVGVLAERGDPHSGFVSVDRKASFDEGFDQQFVGINVRLRPVGDPPRLEIATPLTPDSPARLAGIRPGDVIVAVDGQPIGPLTAEEFNRTVQRVRGKQGTQVDITVERPGAPQPLTFRVTRQLVNIERVLGDVRQDDGTWQFRLASHPTIALVRIAEFGNKTTAEVEQVIAQLVREGIAGVVLDLRHNPGGALDAGVEICELFLRRGQMIVETRNRRGDATAFVARSDGPFATLPLMVLVDGQSASASELVAGCLKDNNRAAVAGQRSYGKGTVQQVIPTQAGRSYLKLTSATFWPPSGRRIHRPIGSDNEPDGDWGIAPSPELQVDMTPEQQAAWYTARLARDNQIAGDPNNPVDEDYHDVVLQAAVASLVEQVESPPVQP
jgi:carboxyl-terminal processing protease